MDFIIQGVFKHSPEAHFIAKNLLGMKTRYYAFQILIFHFPIAIFCPNLEVHISDK